MFFDSISLSYTLGMTGFVDSVDSADSVEYLESNISHHSPSLTHTALSPP